MLPAVKRAPAAATLAAISVLAACGGEDRAASRGDSVERISDTVEALEDALDDRDVKRICDRILSPEGRRRAGGEECERRLRRSTAQVEDPDLELVSVTLGRDAASARVRASAEGERPAIDVIRLVPGEGGFRVEALSGQ